MNNVLEGLQPTSVFSYFEKLSKIPRGSGNEKAISDYLVNFAKERNLQVIQDKALNVVIKKKGTKGYENAPTVILQGHMDMVCEKFKEVEHDFEKEPIKLMVDGDFIKAQGTTLGADNGIAVAFALAILDSNDIAHPPLEVLVTSEEESGMKGAHSLEANNLSGKILINMDSEEEGEFLTSCSGGIRSKINIPIAWNNIDSQFKPYLIKIKGLKGGHSGSEIDKGRASANKLIGRLLSHLNDKIDFYISEINGGAKMNAIARDSEVTVLLKDSEVEKLNELIDELLKIFKGELSAVDPDVDIEVEKLNKNIEKAFSKETLEKIISMLILIPQGIQTMSMEIKGLVQSSTNLGIISTSEKDVKFQSAVRSSVRTLKYDIVNQMKTLTKLVGGQISLEGDYPEWQYKADSYIRKIFRDTYKKMYNKEANITAIHAGLECGILRDVLGDIDMISFGPNMYDVHTPNERLSISSTKKSFEYLVQVLSHIK